VFAEGVAELLLLARPYAATAAALATPRLYATDDSDVAEPMSWAAPARALAQALRRRACDRRMHAAAAVAARARHARVAA
jgi:hypothetical protein